VEATLAPKLRVEDSLLDWSEAAGALSRRVRALAPRPGAFTYLGGERLRILRATALAGAADEPPGTVRLGGPAPLRVACGADWLVPLVLQRPGGNPIDAASFQHGRGIPDGARLGALEAGG
jgi:methionyl-tRNA formyltransferase